MTELHGGDVWPLITRACKTKGPRRAAIAYVGHSAPNGLLPLRRGDVLYVNASDSALLAHATSPEALAQYLNAGIAVYSSSRLHAKVLTTASVTVVGSANASTNSTTLDEAVVVSTSTALRRKADAFIDSLAGSSMEVTDEFLAAARIVWARGRGGGPPGTDGGTQDRPFLPSPPFRIHVAADVEEGAWDDADQKVFDTARRRARRSAGPAARYSLWSLTLGPRVTPYRVGDVVIQIGPGSDGREVWAPGVVVTEPLKVGRRRYVMQLLRYDDELPELSVDEAEARWRRGRRPGRLDKTRWLRDPADRRAALKIWGLSER